MTRAHLLALALAAACGPSTPPPITGGEHNLDDDQPPPGGDPVPVWAGKMSARVTMISARDLPPAVVRALDGLLPPPEALAPNRVMWARPLADGAALLAFTAERVGANPRGQREGVITHGLAGYADGAFTLVASATESWLETGSMHRELAARDLDGDGTLDLIVHRDQRGGDRGVFGLAVYYSSARAIGLVEYGERGDSWVITPEYVCSGPIGGTPAIVVVTRTAAAADDSLIADLFPNVWLPDDKGDYHPTVVWAHELAAAADPGLLVAGWRKASASSAPPAVTVDEEGRLTAVPDCGAGVPLILGNAVRDPDGKGIPGKPFHLVSGLTTDRDAAATTAGGRRLVKLPIAELN